MVDTERHTMVYANAAHPPGVLVGRGDSVRALGVGGPPLGLIPEAHYAEELVTLEPGNLVALVSDGITDAIDASGDAIPAAVGAELARMGAHTPEMACVVLLEAARRSSGPGAVAGWVDDRTVVVFAFSPEWSDAWPATRR